METNYTPKILSIHKKDADGLTDVVTFAEVSYTGNDGVNEYTVHTRIRFDEPSADSFVDYSTLTEEQFLSWCDFSKLQVLVDAELETMKGTIVDEGYFPWEL